MTVLFPTVMGSHFLAAMIRHKTQPNRVMERINEAKTNLQRGTPTSEQEHGANGETTELKQGCLRSPAASPFIQPKGGACHAELNTPTPRTARDCGAGAIFTEETIAEWLHYLTNPDGKYVGDTEARAVLEDVIDRTRKEVVRDLRGMK